MKVYVNTSTKLTGRGLILAGDNDLEKDEIAILKKRGFVAEDEKPKKADEKPADLTK